MKNCGKPAKIPAGCFSSLFESTRTQILPGFLNRNRLYTATVLGYANMWTPPPWKSKITPDSMCRIVGSLSARRRMRSQNRKQDFPDQRLDTARNGVKRRQTDPRLACNNERIRAFMVPPQSVSLCRLVLGPRQELSA